jgi:Methylamine utilisation protein MauE
MVVPDVRALPLYLFFRLLLGCILLSTAITKLTHRQRFRHAILDYRIIPRHLEAKFACSRMVSWGVPLAELGTSFGLISGVWLTPAIILTLIILGTFSSALILNLLRGRSDLSCHCGGSLGNHPISWWLVVRNGLLGLFAIFLFLLPPDLFTVNAFVHHHVSFTSGAWMSTAAPVALLVLAIILFLLLFDVAQSLLRDQ